MCFGSWLGYTTALFGFRGFDWDLVDMFGFGGFDWALTDLFGLCGLLWVRGM